MSEKPDLVEASENITRVQEKKIARICIDFQCVSAKKYHKNITGVSRGYANFSLWVLIPKKVNNFCFGRIHKRLIFNYGTLRKCKFR